MSDLVLIITGGVSLLSVVLIILTVLRGWKSRSNDDEREAEPRRVPVPVPARDTGSAMRRGQRNVRSRMRTAVNRQENLNEDEEEEDPLAEQIALPDGKIGAKKRMKLEMKAEKRAAREREIEEREERKQRQVLLEEQRKKDEEREKQEDAKKAEEERLEKEDREKREYEEYLKMKEAFSVEEEGYEEVLDESQSQNRFQEFITYIQEQKVVLLEDLAAHFKLKTQECIDRVQILLEEEQLTGVLDDRGKFISVTRAELEAVAKFIRQRGRLPITELVEASNQLINLTPLSAGTSVA